MVRTQTSLICNVWLEKKVDFRNVWPIDEVDEGTKVKRLTRQAQHKIFENAHRRELERRMLNSKN